MKAKLFRWLLAGGCALLAACAIITVNVYFPEEAAKEAYKSLDGMLLKDDEQKSPAEEKQQAPEQKPSEAQPQSRLFKVMPTFSLVPEAHANGNFADDLAVEIASMPEVVKAYEEMNQRLPRVSALFASGAIGLTNQGLLAIRDRTKAGAQDEGLVNAENQNRKAVVTGMAKAIIKLNKQPVSKEAMDQVMAKAAATYAEAKRDAAKQGWWIQLQNGRWVQK